MRARLDRRIVAAAVLVLWAAGLLFLALRRHNVPVAERLARGVMRLEPATYFYVVTQGGNTIGYASSTIDTSAAGFTARHIVRIRTVIAGDSQSISASSSARLNRAFVMDGFVITVGGGEHPFRVQRTQPAGSNVLLPTLAPIAMMLERGPRIGDSTSTRIYNPVTRRTERVTMTIAAESLFSVVDSAALDPNRHIWIPAHSDTVRSWQVVIPSGALTAWVDARGRIVTASEAGGAALTRTAYEIATQNPKLLSH